MPSLILRPRSSALTPFVASLHYHEGAMPATSTLERILPNGRIHLMVNLDEDEFRTYAGARGDTLCRTHGAVLAGPHAKSTVIDTREQRCLATVDFKLGGAASFFDLPLTEARDQLVELDQLWGRDGGVLRERLLEAQTPRQKLRILEAVLLEQLVRLQMPDPAIPLAASALNRGFSVSQVASRLGLPPKTFVRRFRERVGLSPKRFSRVARLQRIVRSVRNPGSADWAEVAAEYGYTDQAHLIHDFRDLTGITPTAFWPRSAAEFNHVPVMPSRR